MLRQLIKFFKDEEGIETIEYALIAALIAIAVIAGATFLGDSTNEIYNAVGGLLNTGAGQIPTSF